jgi:hypothetical protein
MFIRIIDTTPDIPIHLCSPKRSANIPSKKLTGSDAIKTNKIIALQGCSKSSLEVSAAGGASRNLNTGRVALIAGSTGIVGGNLAALLVEQGWIVYGLARRPSSTGGVIPLAADLRDRSALVAALDGIAPTHVFFCSRIRPGWTNMHLNINQPGPEALF